VCHGRNKNSSGAHQEAENIKHKKQCSGAIKNMADRQLHQLDGVQLTLKLSGGSWRTSTGKVFHSPIALGKRV